MQFVNKRVLDMQCIPCIIGRMATLDQYLSERSISNADFARQIGRDASFVSRMRAGDASPSIETLAKIKEATSGEVDVEDFVKTEAAQ